MKNETRKIHCPTCNKDVEVKFKLHGDTRLGDCPNCGAILNERPTEISSWKSIMTMIILMM